MSVRIDKKTESEVWEEIKKGELSYTQISKKYGISKTTVTNVRIRQTQNYKNTRRLSLKERENIIQDIRDNKLRRIEVVRKYNISYYSASYYVAKANNTKSQTLRTYVTDTDNIGHIISAIKEGMTNTEIVSKYKVSLHRVIEIKRKYTDKLNSKPCDTERVKLIYDMIDKGYTNNAVIADAVGASRALVSYYRRKITI